MDEIKYGPKYYNDKYKSIFHSSTEENMEDYGTHFIRVQGVLNSVEGDLILDAACSKGDLTLNLEKFFEVVGLDFSTNALAIAKKRCTQAIFVSGDVCNLPFHNKFFDSVVAGEILEHLTEPRKFLDECKRILKDEGVLVVTLPNGFGLWSIFYDRLLPKITGHNPEGHVHTFSFKRICRLLSANNFEIEAVINTGLFGIGIPLTRFKLRHPMYLDSKIAKYVPHEIALGWVIKARLKT